MTGNSMSTAANAERVMTLAAAWARAYREWEQHGQPADMRSWHWRCECGAQGPRTTGDQVSIAWNTRAAPPATA